MSLKFSNDLQDISQELREADDDLRKKFDALLRDAEIRANQTIPSKARQDSAPKSPNRISVVIADSPKRIIVDDDYYLPKASRLSSNAATAASSPLLSSARALPVEKPAQATPKFAQKHSLSPDRLSPTSLDIIPDLSILKTEDAQTRPSAESLETNYRTLAELPEENNSRAVLTALRALQSKIQSLERDKIAAKERIASLETELGKANRNLYQTAAAKEEPGHDSRSLQLERQLDYTKFLLDQAQSERTEQERTLSMTKEEAESLRKQLSQIKRQDTQRLNSQGRNWEPVLREIEADRRERAADKSKSAAPHWRSFSGGNKTRSKTPATARPATAKPSQRKPPVKAQTFQTPNHPRQVPFIVGQHAGKSFSVTANLQQVFSMLKSHNAALCVQCRDNLPCLHLNLASQNSRSSAKHDHHSSHLHPKRIASAAQEATKLASGPAVANLERVLDLLLSELDIFKRQYKVLVQQYDRLLNIERTLANSNKFDAAQHQHKLKTTSDKLRLVMEQMEAKDEQIAVLRGVLSSAQSVDALDSKVAAAASKASARPMSRRPVVSAAEPAEQASQQSSYSFQRPSSPARNDPIVMKQVPSFLRANAPMDTLTNTGLAPTFSDEPTMPTGQLFDTKLDSLALLKTSQKVQSLLKEQRVE